jgi:DNA-binding NtrC family response regulator
MAAQETVLAALVAEHETLRPRAVISGIGAGLLGAGELAERCRELCSTFARRQEPVLLTGERGSGRRQLAESMHRISERSDAPFELVNCAALPPEVIDVELCGAGQEAELEAGGAVSRAEEGTLCLHEIQALGPLAQAAVLQILEENAHGQGRVPDVRHADVRVLATTSEDLEAAARGGMFDASLLARLSVLSVEVPALRDRPEDIAVLANRFLIRAARRVDKTVLGFSTQALEALIGYHWPGNVRELELEMERLASVVRADATVELSQLSSDIRASTPVSPSLPPELEGLADGSLETARDAFERWMVERALAECDGNQTRAAARLGLSRAGLFKKMKRLRM